RRAPAFVNEAQECLGGNGYVEESMVARLYRQAPLNSIWEGSGNVQCLDALRALAREPGSGEALMAEIGAAGGMDPGVDRVAGAFRRTRVCGEHGLALGTRPPALVSPAVIERALPA